MRTLPAPGTIYGRMSHQLQVREKTPPFASSLLLLKNGQQLLGQTASPSLPGPDGDWPLSPTGRS